MGSSDSAFTGSIPSLYDRYLGPLLFEPYADDLARRAAALRPQRILEVAAGTGIASAALMARLPDASLTVTDLNPDMLAVAMERLALAAGRVEFRAADAQALPFEDVCFDLVVCQFGAMFFPNRMEAYREARRVLRPGGHYLLNVWDRIERNPVSAAVASAVARLFPDNPPGFLERTPFGYHDRAQVEAELVDAGFVSVRAWTVETSSRRPAREAALGLCAGSPLRAEIEAHDPARLDEAIAAATVAIAELGDDEAIDAPMAAHVFEAVA